MSGPRSPCHQIVSAPTQQRRQGERREEVEAGDGRKICAQGEPLDREAHYVCTTWTVRFLGLHAWCVNHPLTSKSRAEQSQATGQQGRVQRWGWRVGLPTSRPVVDDARRDGLRVAPHCSCCLEDGL